MKKVHAKTESSGLPKNEHLAQTKLPNANQVEVEWTSMACSLYGTRPHVRLPKQKSGLLTPSFGYDDDLGINMTQKYYWAIAPDQDATFGMMLTSKELPVALMEYRQRFSKAHMEFEGSLTYSDREVDETGGRRDEHEEVRGHIFGEARIDINDLWRAGLQVEISSDDQYLREYNFKSKDVLKNDPFFQDKRNKKLAGILEWLIKEKKRCEQQAYFSVDPRDPHIVEKIIIDKIKRKSYI